MYPVFAYSTQNQKQNFERRLGGGGRGEHFNYKGQTSNRYKVEHTVPCIMKSEGGKEF